VDAQLAIARLCDGEEPHDLANEWFRRAANGGNTEAAAALGKRLLTFEAYITKPVLAREGIALTLAAAEAGHPEAQHAAAMLTSAGLGVDQDWETALDFLTGAAQNGFARARTELAMLARETETDSESGGEIDWQRLRKKIDLAPWFEIPPGKILSHAPRVAAIPNFLSHRLCDWLIERAKPNLTGASLFDPETGERTLSTQRSNSAIMFNIFEMDIFLTIQQQRIATVTGLRGQPEYPNVLHYAVGQQYAAHFDFINTRAPGDAATLVQGMQRVLTFLVYLNDDYDGGDTEFPRSPLRFKGNKGDALFFWNVDRAGAPDPLTLHAGTAPVRGEKWLFSQWVDA
jgi:prolyl 4-hydroxylase